MLNGQDKTNSLLKISNLVLRFVPRWPQNLKQNWLKQALSLANYELWYVEFVPKKLCALLKLKKVFLEVN